MQIIIFKYQEMAGHVPFTFCARYTSKIPRKKDKRISGMSLNFCVRDVRFENGVGSHTQFKNITVEIFLT
jgi:hypothetical protein